MSTVKENRVEDSIGIGILCSDYSHCEIEENSIVDTRPDLRLRQPLAAGVRNRLELRRQGKPEGQQAGADAPRSDHVRGGDGRARATDRSAARFARRSIHAAPEAAGRRSRMGRMPLALFVGPANAGKVARLLDRYLAALDREPFLVVPNETDVERVERELIARAGRPPRRADRHVRRPLRPRPRRCRSRRAGLATARARPRRAVAAHRARRRGRLAERARRLRALPRLRGRARATPSPISSPRSSATTRSKATSRALRGLSRRARPARRLGSRPGARAGRRARRLRPRRLGRNARPRLRLRGPDRRAVDAARGARRRGSTSPSPFRTSRGAPSSRRSSGRRPIWPAWPPAESRSCRRSPGTTRPRSRHLERTLFAETTSEPPPLDGAVRFLEAAGSRAVLELVGEEILALLRDGTAPEEIAVVAPSVEKLRAPLETVFAELGIPYALEGRLALGRTPFGQALLGLLRYAWLGGGRQELFAFLRSPYSGLPRTRADFVEGRLRGPGGVGSGARRGGDAEPPRPRHPCPRRAAGRGGELSARARPRAGRVDAPGRLRARGAADRRGRAARSPGA